jgi:hypothetical protein
MPTKVIIFGSYCLAVTDFILRVSGATGGFFQNLDRRHPVGSQYREKRVGHLGIKPLSIDINI